VIGRYEYGILAMICFFFFLLGVGRVLNEVSSPGRVGFPAPFCWVFGVVKWWWVEITVDAKETRRTVLRCARSSPVGLHLQSPSRVRNSGESLSASAVLYEYSSIPNCCCYCIVKHLLALVLVQYSSNTLPTISHPKTPKPA